MRRECLQIITHMLSTAQSLQKIFNPEIAAKVRYVPLGVPARSNEEICETYQKKFKGNIALFFSCSWHQENFEVRGGLDVLEAFDILCSKYNNLSLVIKCKMPQQIPQKHFKILEKYLNKKIFIIQEKLSDADMTSLMKKSDIFLIPSARIHVVSILNTMALGMPVVASDAWNTKEYIEDNVNGMIVSGRYGKTSWVDEDGLLREDYRILYQGDSEFALKLAQKIDFLIQNDDFRFQITKNAMNDIHTKYSIERYNVGLKRCYDECYKLVDSYAKTFDKKSF